MGINPPGFEADLLSGHRLAEHLQDGSLLSAAHDPPSHLGDFAHLSVTNFHYLYLPLIRFGKTFRKKSEQNEGKAFKNAVTAGSHGSLSIRQSPGSRERSGAAGPVSG